MTPSKIRSARMRFLFGAIFAGALLLASCGDADREPIISVPDGTGQITAPPDGTAPPETAPPETAPTPTNLPEQPAPAEPTDDEDGDGKIFLAILIGVGVILLVLIASSRMGRNKTASAPPQEVAPPTPSPKRQLLGNVQWLHDQLSLELLSGSAEQAKLRWTTERGRADNMSIQCQQLAADGAGPVWQQLAGSISSLSGALDTAVNLRADEQADPGIVREAINVVNRNRNEMQPIITAAAQTA